MTLLYILIIILVIMMIVVGYSMIARLRPQTKNGTSFWDKRAHKLIHKRPYSIYDIFSYSFVLIASIFLLIFPIIKNLQKPDANYGMQISALILIILLDLCLLGALLKNIKIHLLYHKASINGEIVEGTIINYCHRSSSKTPACYYVVIKYNDINTGEEKVFRTPSLSFIPYISLGSNKCDVCFYKNEIIASGFKSILDTNAGHIYLPEDNSYLNNYTTFQKAIAILALILTLVFAYFSIFSKPAKTFPSTNRSSYFYSR